MTTYFINCKNLDELKKAYKAAAMQNHPDKGGDTATMQAINAEYSARFEVLKRSQNEQAAEDTTGRTHATTESAGDFIAIIAALLKLDGLEIELCGLDRRQHQGAQGSPEGCRVPVEQHEKALVLAFRRRRPALAQGHQDHGRDPQQVRQHHLCPLHHFRRTPGLTGARHHQKGA